MQPKKIPTKLDLRTRMKTVIFIVMIWGVCRTVWWLLWRDHISPCNIFIHGRSQMIAAYICQSLKNCIKGEGREEKELYYGRLGDMKNGWSFSIRRVETLCRYVIYDSGDRHLFRNRRFRKGSSTRGIFSCFLNKTKYYMEVKIYKDTCRH